MLYKNNTISRTQLVELLHFSDEYFVPSLSYFGSIETLADKIHKNAQLFEAWNNGKVVGLLACYANDIVNKKGFITFVFIHPDFQKQHLATTLLGNCLSYLSEHHFNRVGLEVHQNNIPAQKLYEKAGFTITQKNDPMWQMEKTL